MNGVRIAITGLGVLSPIGDDIASTTAALLSARSGVGLMSLDWNGGRLSELGAPVALHPSQTDGRTRIQSMLDYATDCAVDAADVNSEQARVGACIGTGETPADAAADREPQLRWYQHQASRIARRIDARGPVYGCYTACATGNDLIGLGVDTIRRGEADIMVCAAADSQLAPTSVLEFRLLNALADRSAALPQPRPFDRLRCGFVLGEGAGAVVLESAGHAVRRGAQVLAEVRGWGAATDAYSLTRGHPAAAGATRAIRAALQDSGLAPTDVDYVNAHATGTAVGDALEVVALKTVWGSAARLPPVSSTKSMTGHTLAASSLLECAFCVIALQRQFAPPTVNYEFADPDCDIDCVPGQARELELNVVMSSALGFGGQNACIVLSRFR
jgi:3-oxoacyl-[acyl-carrier-protein] synthase II